MGGWASREARQAWTTRNREKLNAQAREYARLHPDAVRERQRACNQRLKDHANTFKARPCLDCKQTHPLCCMQFDHVRGTKTADIARLLAGKSLARLIAEISLCDVVCANCHAIRTASRPRPNTLKARERKS